MMQYLDSDSNFGRGLEECVCDAKVLSEVISEWYRIMSDFYYFAYISVFSNNNTLIKVAFIIFKVI